MYGLRVWSIVVTYEDSTIWLIKRENHVYLLWLFSISTVQKATWMKGTHFDSATDTHSRTCGIWKASWSDAWRIFTLFKVKQQLAGFELWTHFAFACSSNFILFNSNLMEAAIVWRQKVKPKVTTNIKYHTQCVSFPLLYSPSLGSFHCYKMDSHQIKELHLKLQTLLQSYKSVCLLSCLSVSPLLSHFSPFLSLCALIGAHVCVSVMYLMGVGGDLKRVC